MRKIKISIAFAASIALCMGMMTGCGDKNKKTSGVISSDATATSSDATDTVDKDDMTIDEYIEFYGGSVELGEYMGLEYTSEATEVTDDEVEEEVNSLISTATTYDEDYESTAQTGDTVNIDFVGYIDGEAFDGGDTEGSGYDIELGSGGLIDDFEDQIAGHVPGDTFTVEVTFPDDYGNDDLNGKDAQFETTLNYIKVANVPELTDELVAENTDCSTIDEYREEVRANLQEEYDETAYTYAQSIVMTEAIDNATISDLPVSEVESLQDDIITAINDEATNYGIDYATYIYYYYGYDDEDSFAEYVYSVCEESVKEKMVVCAIAKAEGIVVDSDDVDSYVEESAASYGVTADDLRESYSETDLMYYALADKVMALLMDNAVEVEDTETTTEAE